MEKITKITANAHTHTTFCDGKCSAEEMVQAAIAEGFHCLVSILFFQSQDFFPV